MTTDIRPFGHSRDGRRVDAIRLSSGTLSVTVLTRGAVVQDVRLAGVDHSLTLGCDRIEAYEGPAGYFGALVGPVANRIGGAQAVIGGQDCRFAPNEGTTLLHGGTHGMHTRHWAVDAAGADFARLRMVLDAGDSGFPGRREISADFRVAGASLTLVLTATTDAATLINLANHSYWNLDGTPDVAGHTLRIAADHYLPITAQVLPTGEIRPVDGVFDLRAGRVIDQTEGYDHNFCLADAPRALTDVAWLTGRSGLRMTVASTEPGLQVYGGARVATTPFAGHGGMPYAAFGGIAIEAQRWPDATNHPAFPSVALAVGETYRQETQWTFGRG